MDPRFGKAALVALVLMVVLPPGLNGNTDGLVDLCVNLIEKGEYVEALTELQKAQDSSQLALIVKRVYNGRIANFDQIVEFIKVLPETEKSLDSLAYETLYETMKEFNHLDNAKVLVLYDLVSKSGHSELASILKTPRRNIMAKWANDISHNDYKPILAFYKKYPKVLNNHLRLLIQESFETNSIHVNKTLVLITKLSKSSEKVAGYTYLYKLLKNKNELNSSLVVDLACLVRDDYDESNKHFKSLKEKLPIAIQSVIWSDYIHIESKSFPDYTLYGSQPGNIYTYPTDNYPGGRNQMWKVERETLQGSCYFRFHNIQNSGVLTDGGKYAKNSAVVSEVGHNRDKQFWKTVPLGKGEYVEITDKSEGRWLDAGKLTPCPSSRKCCCSTVLMSSIKEGIEKGWKIH